MMSVYVAMFVLQDRHKEANMQIFLDLTVHLFVTKNTLLCCKKMLLTEYIHFCCCCFVFSHKSTTSNAGPQIFCPEFLSEFSF